MEMPCLEKLRKIKRYQTIPVVMSIREVEATSARMTGTTRLMAKLMYGAGLRIGECMTLRVKDIDFDLRSISVRAAKGNKDRTTLLPQALIPVLRNHLLKVYQLHNTDLLHGNGYAPKPNALYKKYPLSLQVLWLAVCFLSNRYSFLTGLSQTYGSASLKGRMPNTKFVSRFVRVR
jgi:integrase